MLFFANVFRRTWMLPSVGLALLALSAILLGVLWPGVVQQFQVSPSEPDKEAPYIARNIEATRAAYDIDDVETTPYNANSTLSSGQLKADAQSIPGIRLIDPSVVSDTFEQLQQVRGYYSVPDVLDVDRYPVEGELRDMVVAPRELDQSGLSEEQRNWANLHTVYTHGYGVVAAFGNQRNAQGDVATNDGEPEWAEQDLPPRGELSEPTPDGYQPRIYFGEKSPTYSIVGKSEGGRDVELDIPEGAGPGAAPSTNTYDGAAGVPVGGFFNKLLYAVKFSEPNIVLSSRVNENSKIIYDREPRLRVQKVAPWLTVDGDSYPAVVDGKVVWILDAYTTTDRYPMAEKRSLSDMTSDSLQPRTGLRHAADRRDQLHAQLGQGGRRRVRRLGDPLRVGPGGPDPQGLVGGVPGRGAADGVDPRGPAPAHALPRGPVQGAAQPARGVPRDAARARSTRARTAGEVPEDPTKQAQSQPPYRLSVKTPGSEASEPVFSLTSVYVPQSRQNLASFISVDADASQEEYGTIRILRLPSNTQIPGPSQIANQFGADQEIQNALLAFTRTNSKAVYGNLLTLPVGNGLLYVQPLYTLRQSGEGPTRCCATCWSPSARTSATAHPGRGARRRARRDGFRGLPEPAGGTPSGGTGNQPGGGAVPDDVTSLLRQAEEAFAAAEQALQDKDLQGYADASERARDLVEQALRAADQLDARVRPTEVRRAAAPPGVAARPRGGSGGGAHRRRRAGGAARAGDRRHSVIRPDLAGTASVP